MKGLWCLSFLSWFLVGSLSLSHSADTLPQPADFRETPSPIRLFLNQWSSYPAAPGGLAADFLRSSDEETAELTLTEAILVGLKNNPGIQVDRLEPLLAAENTFNEKSIFDPTLNLEFSKDFAIDPSGTRASAFSSVVRLSRNKNWNLSLKKLLRTGTQLQLSFLNNEQFTTFPTQVLRPTFKPTLGFSLTQPLLRDFGWGLTTIFVRIDENREGMTLYDYQARLAQLTQRITEAYWGVVFARQNVSVQEKGVELADALLRGAQARVRAGTQPPVAITEADAEKARREQLLITAQNDLEVARTNLRLTLSLNPKNTFLPRKIEPVENPSVELSKFDRVQTMETALTRRPEIRSANLQVQNQALQLRYAENQLLPRLDLRAGANLVGLSGDRDKALRDATTGEPFNNPFAGGYASGFDRLFSGNFYNYQVGIILQIPLGNGQARSNLSIARIKLGQAKARQRDLISQVTLQVETALANMEANFKRIQSAQEARRLAEENLRAQQKRFGVGLVTQKDVIDFQSRFLDAQGVELQAITDYNNSLSSLMLAEGTLLEHNNIHIEGPKKEADPWWARF